MNNWIEQLARGAGMSPDTVVKLLQTAVIFLIYLVTRRVSYRLIRRRVQNPKRHYQWRRGVNYITGTVLLVLLAGVWLTGLENTGTALGLVTAGLAIGLQDPLTDLAGWLFIIARRPFIVGDRIEIANHIGDVIDIRLFHTHLLECGKRIGAEQATGRVLAVPNGMFFKSPLANYTRDFEYVWDEVPVLVTFESDWKKAKKILIDISQTVARPMSAGAEEQIRQAARKQMIFFQNLTPIVYTEVKDSGVLLTLRYLTPPRRRRGNLERIWEAILEAFGDQPCIDLAYPTHREYRNDTEGKPGARAQRPESLGPGG